MRLFGEVVLKNSYALPSKPALVLGAMSIGFLSTQIFEGIDIEVVRHPNITILWNFGCFAAILIILIRLGGSIRHATEFRPIARTPNDSGSLIPLDLDALAKLKRRAPVDWTIQDSVGGYLITQCGRDILLWKRNWKEGTRPHPSGDGQEVCTWSVWVKEGVDDPVAMQIIRQTWFDVSRL